MGKGEQDTRSTLAARVSRFRNAEMETARGVRSKDSGAGVSWDIIFPPAGRAQEWLVALNRAVQQEFPEGTRGRNLTLRMDNGCQPTSRAYQDALQTLGVNREWTGYNCLEQNAHVERVIGILKYENGWVTINQNTKVEITPKSAQVYLDF